MIALKYGFGSLRLADFVVGTYPTASSLRLALAFLLAASLLPLLFRSRGEWLVDFGRRRRPKPILKFLNAFVGGVELTTQGRDEIDGSFGPDPPLSHILLELVNGIHGPASLTNPPDLENAAFTQ